MSLTTYPFRTPSALSFTMKILAPVRMEARGRVGLLVPRWTPAHQEQPQGTPFRSFSMGAAFLAAGYEVVFFDQEHDLDRVDRSAELIEALRGGVAAFLWLNECYPTNQFSNTVRLATLLKDALPELPVTVGGELITLCPAEFFEIDGPVDFFLRGYGEESGVALLDHLLAGSEPKGLPGLTRRLADGTFDSQAKRSVSSYPPEFLELYHRVDLSGYIQRGGVFGNDQPTLSVAFGRGCTKGCSFCCWRNHKARILGPEHAFELMCELRERYDVKQFHIAELDFFVSRARALGLAKRIRESGSDITWYALGSPIDLIEYSDEDWDALRDGGLTKVELGSESGSARMLRAIGKRHGPEDVYAVSMSLLERGIVPMNNFLFGFPGETHEDRTATLSLIDRLIEVGSTRNHFTYRHYQPTWDTPLGDEALAQVQGRARRIDTWLVEHGRYAQASERTMPWLPHDDERELKQLIDFELPLATSQLVIESPWRRRVYEKLRSRAQAGLRGGGRPRRLDRWIYDRVVAGALDRTFVP